MGDFEVLLMIFAIAMFWFSRLTPMPIVLIWVAWIDIAAVSLLILRGL